MVTSAVLSAASDSLNIQSEFAKLHATFQKLESVAPEKTETSLTLIEGTVDHIGTLGQALTAENQRLLEAFALPTNTAYRAQIPETEAVPFPAASERHSLLRAAIMAGKADSVHKIFENFAVHVSLMKWKLHFLDKAADLRGLKCERETPTKAYCLPRGDYEVVRTSLLDVLSKFQEVFPELPSYPAGETKAQSQRPQWRPIPERVDALLRFFSRTGIPNSEEAQFVLSLLYLVEDATGAVLSYRSLFPASHNEAQIAFEASKLLTLPGAMECLRFSYGLSDFTGEACQPQKFREALQSLAKTYRTLVGPQILLRTLEHIESVKSHDGALEDSTGFWTKQTNALAKNLQKHGVTLTAEAKSALDRFFAKLVESPELVDDGLALGRTLKNELRGHLPQSFGFEGDHALLAEQSESLLNKFDAALRNHPAGLTRAVFYRPDAFLESCALVAEEKKGASEWVLFPKYEALGAGHNENQTTFGTRALTPVYEVVAGDFAAIQHRNEGKPRLLGGLAVQLALRQIVPVLVQTKSLLGEPVGATLQDLGIKLGKAQPELELASQHFHLGPWESVIENSKEAAAKTAADFAMLGMGLSERDYFRKKTLEAAGQMKALAEQLAKIEDPADAARVAPSVAKVLALREEDFPPGSAAGLNLSLIREFLPTVIFEYINAYPFAGKWSGKGKTKAERDALYQRLHGGSEFTVDQLRDMLDWYLFGPAHQAGKLTRDGDTPPRPFSYPGQYSATKTALCGVEELQLLYRQPILLARIFEHTRNSHARPVQYLKYALKKLEWLHPHLMLGNAYQTYTDTKFEAVMQAYLANAREEANRVANLVFERRSTASYPSHLLTTTAETLLWWRSVKDQLGYFVPLLPLMDSLVRNHPQLKLALCEEQSSLGLTDSVIDNTLFALGMAGAVAAYIPPLQLGAIALDAGILYMQIGRSYRKGQELARLERLTLAGVGQSGPEGFERNEALTQVLEAEYGAALASAVLNGALVGPAVALQFPKLMAQSARLAQRSFSVVQSSMLRGWAVATRAEAAAAKAARWSVWYKKLPAPLSKSFSVLARSYRALAHPLEEIGLIEKVSLRKLRLTYGRAFKEMYRLVSRTKVPTNTAAASRRVYSLDALLESFNLLGSMHWRILFGGYKFGGGPAGQALGYAFMGEAGLFLWNLSKDYSEIDALNRLEEIHHNHNGKLTDYLEASYNGEFTETELEFMVRLDKQLVDTYGTKVRLLSETYAQNIPADERAVVAERMRWHRQQMAEELNSIRQSSDTHRSSTLPYETNLKILDELIQHTE